MNISPQSAAPTTGKPAYILGSLDWIEVAALPVIVSIMEAQPTILLLWLSGIVLAGSDSLIVLDPGTIILLLLGLYWWAIVVKRFRRVATAETRITILNLAGLFLALAVAFGTHLSVIAQPLPLLLTTLVVLWCWQRGLIRALASRRAERLATTFRREFLVLLAVLIIAAITPAVGAQLLPVFAVSLPVFFLSGLIVFSLLRLQTTRAAYQRRFANNRHADPTRPWFILIALLWGIIVGAAIIMETVAFPYIAAALAPLRALAALVYNALDALLGLLLQSPPKPVRLPGPIKLPRHLTPPPQFHNPLLAAFLAFVAFAAIAAIVIVVIMLWYRNYRYTREDEVRRGVSIRASLQEQRQRKTRFKDEQLDPASARAYYREFLRLMARQEEELARNSAETPNEYQDRLLALLETMPESTTDQELSWWNRVYVNSRAQRRQKNVGAQFIAPTSSTSPTPGELLRELTRAYTQERYGGRKLLAGDRSSWRTKIHALARSFKSSHFMP